MAAITFVRPINYIYVLIGRTNKISCRGKFLTCSFRIPLCGVIHHLILLFSAKGGLNVLSLLPPLKIACNGYEDIEPIEESLEGDALVNIKRTADNIDDQPEQPLLKEFARQSP